MKDRLGFASPVRFAQSWQRYKIDDLAQLTRPQAAELWKEAVKFAKWGAKQTEKERIRDERRERERRELYGE